MTSALRPPSPETRRAAPSTEGTQPDAAQGAVLIDLEIDNIRFRRNFRQTLAPQALRELASSIRMYGVLEPVIARPCGDGRHELVAGERRTHAARMAGLRTVPAIVRDTDAQHADLLQVAENIHRENLSRLETARMLRTLLDECKTLDAVAARINKSKGWVSERLQLLKLEPAALALIADGITSDVDVINAVNRAERIDHDAGDVLAQKVRNAVKKRDVARQGLEEIRRHCSTRPPPLTTCRDPRSEHRAEVERMATQLARIGTSTSTAPQRTRVFRGVLAQSLPSVRAALQRSLEMAHSVGAGLRRRGAIGMNDAILELAPLLGARSLAAGWPQMVLRSYSIGMLGEPFEFDRVVTGR